MKVMNIQDPQEFLKVIDGCKGQVELVTADEIMPAGFFIYHF